MAWLGLYRPEPHELGELAEQYDLPELAVEDAIKAHQRPKFERYGGTLFVVLKAARYLDAAEEVEFGELHLFLGQGLRDHRPAQRVAGPLPGAPAAGERAGAAGQGQRGGALRDPGRRRRRVRPGGRRAWRTTSTRSRPRSSAATRRCPGASTSCPRRCWSSSAPPQPLTGILAAITAGFDKYGVDEELRSYLRDVADHVTQVNERVEGFRLQLRDILTVNATLVAQRQNEEIRELTEASIAQGEEVKKISAWAAILFAPTLVGTVYGMNFDAHARAGLAARLPAGPAADARRSASSCTWCSSGATGSEPGGRLGGRRGASSGCPAAPSCAAAGSGDAAVPADFALVLADGPAAAVAAPAGPLAGLPGADRHAPTRSTRCTRRAAGRRRGSGSRSPAAGESAAPGRRWPRSPSSTG